jgi:hypothetical protein
MRVAIHDSKSLQIIVMGIPIDDGRPKEGVLEIEFPEQFTEVDSADGLVMRCKTLDVKFPTMLKLLHSSKATDQLWAVHAADVMATGGAGVGPFLVIDGSGSTKMAGQCWVKKAPKRVYGNTVQEETWSLMVIAEMATMALGGNVVEL